MPKRYQVTIMGYVTIEESEKAEVENAAFEAVQELGLEELEVSLSEAP